MLLKLHSWICDVLDGVLLACIWCCLPHKLHSVKNFLTFVCQLFLYLRKKTLETVSLKFFIFKFYLLDKSINKCCSMPNCLMHWHLCCPGRITSAPGHASSPTGSSEGVRHYGGVFRIWHQASRSPFVHLLIPIINCSRVPYLNMYLVLQ